MDRPEAVRSLITTIYANGFNSGDEAVFDRAYAPTFVHHSKVIHGVAPGGEGEKESMRRFRSAIPDVRFEIVDLVATELTAIARLRVLGYATEPFGTVPAGPVDIHAVAWFKVTDDPVTPQVAEEWFFTDAARSS